MNHTIQLRAGTLRLQVERAELPLEELCGFGTRRNRKRGFLFISKVLGKHIPVRPSVMEDVHRRLASRLLTVPGPVVMIGLAETATALGQGVFEWLLRLTGRTDVLFLHTTRYRLNRPLAFTFEESHSHATEHLLYQPADGDSAELFRAARSLVLVDDEISTGRTLLNLARAYSRVNREWEPRPYLVSITDWGASQREESAEDGRRIHLLRGRFLFDPDPRFDAGPLPDVRGRGLSKDSILPRTGGRQGVRSLLALDQDRLMKEAGFRPGERILVLGTGEFAYPPYLFARELEHRGWDVWYQSTTRSPILVGEDVCGANEFVDNYGDEIPNYVYNVADLRYDRIAIGYETDPLPGSHRLPEMLGARPLFFPMEEKR
jgi:hypothetical protein